MSQSLSCDCQTIVDEYDKCFELMIVRTILPSILPRIQAPALALALLIGTAASLLGDTAYITTNSIDGISLLPPPPARGSAEEVADLASVRAVFYGRTAAEKSRASKESAVTLSLFQPAL